MSPAPVTIFVFLYEKSNPVELKLEDIQVNLFYIFE